MRSFIRPCALTFLIPFIGLGCAGKKNPQDGTNRTAKGHSPQSVQFSPKPGSKVDRIIKTSLVEWEFFGKQEVVIQNDRESIPVVGKWEDEGDLWADRINLYWRGVGKPRLDGYDLKQPWSAAFISYVMETSGLNEWEFPGSDAHWNYIRYFESQKYTHPSFLTHPIKDYAPKPGDLICATRGNTGFIPLYDAMDTSSVLMGHAKLHCDIVTGIDQDGLEAIGGNVRNSVSKTRIDLTPEGKLKPSERRPWFVVLENQLDD